jgi:uncharacterized protein (DUF952 family)
MGSARCSPRPPDSGLRTPRHSQERKVILQERKVILVIFYLLLREEWETARSDQIATPTEQEGFVHCCDEVQVEHVRRRYFPAHEEVIALGFDPTQLHAETRYEPGAGGEPERFPHVYGELRRHAVLVVREA